MRTANSSRSKIADALGGEPAEWVSPMNDAANPMDAELVEQCTRARRVGNELRIEACKIAWNTPHTPTSTWVEASRLPADASSEQITAARFELLERPDLFVVCLECGRRRPEGHTNDRICHSCLERNHHVVF